MGIDSLSLSGHKLYARRRGRCTCGGKTRGCGRPADRRRRPRARQALRHPGGPLIVGLGTACDLCYREMPEESQKTMRLRERLRKGLMDRVGESVRQRPPDRAAAGNITSASPTSRARR